MGFIMKRLSVLYRENAKIKVYPFGCTQKRVLSDFNVFKNEDDKLLPVLIVGAGPVGLVLAILLTKLGKMLILCSLFQFFSF